MRPTFHVAAAVFLSLFVAKAATADARQLQAILARPILAPGTPLSEVQAFCESRISTVPEAKGVKDWESRAAQIRKDVLDKIVFRGVPAAWRDSSKLKVEWLDTIPGGPGYSIRKLRYEALPGLWVPALLYVPEKLAGRVPVVVNVNGHVGAEGKAIGYKQVICINQAKRGMLALNVEWLGMGQLADEGYNHNRLNQLDLCGTSGLAPFYLFMTRALDVLLAHPNADPNHVAVTGLSGGGWQTIVLSSLDPRVTLSVPVAGYSSLRTRARHLGDLGDSEQTPNDIATVADYTHLTALLAPRPSLLIYNAKDECCFASAHALAPLIDAAAPAFALYGKRESLRAHVNEVPGTHNYEKDNREAFYRMVGDHFFAGDASYPREEIPSETEIKSFEELRVELPAQNATLNSLALSLAKDLPHPAEGDWRTRLRELVRFRDYQPLKAERVDAAEADGVSTVQWRLKIDAAWTVPAVEFTRASTTPTATAVVLNDAGRKASADVADRLLKEGRRVVAVDLYSFGEAAPATHAYLLSLLVAATGERPLGVEASQLSAVARWLKDSHKQPVTVVATGPRSTTVARVAAALDADAVAGVELTGALGSFKALIDKNRTVEEMPDLFCFGLLESFDVPQLDALIAPRPVKPHD